ncbi:hypothetical protein PGB90_006276 [Kerria lacca]
MEKAGGAWCPKQQIEHDVREYLQMDLERVHTITGIQTQGRFDHGRGQEYAEEYTIEYLRPNMDSWKKYKRWDGKEIMTGNSDTSSVVTHTLMPPMYASKIRILPYSIHRRTVCIRVEIKGCPLQSGIVSYEIPEDSSWKEGEYLSDISYDGMRMDGYLVRGLGCLVDGILGGDNFKIDIGYGKGNGWVGWQNESFPTSYIELIFQFDKIRNFSSVHIFTNNGFKNGVQVFSKARIVFSVGGQYYNSQPVIYTYMPDTILENARNVTIHLNHNIGKYLKIRLFFANKWIMLSEVNFDSEIVSDNVPEEHKLEPNNEEIYVISGGVIDPPWDPPQTISAKKKQSTGNSIELVIGLLTALVLLLFGIFNVLMNTSPTANGVTINPTRIYEEGQQFKNELTTVIEQLTEETDNADNVPKKIYESSITTKKPDLVILEKQSNRDTIKYNQNSSCYEMPVECISDDDINYNNNDADDSNVHQIEYGNLKLKRDNSVYSPTLYKSLRKVTQEPILSLVPPLVPSEKLQFDKSMIYETTKKRYHTSPHNKHRTLPPAVSWNISPATGMPYKCQEGDIVPLPRYFFKVCSKFGSCHLGEIILCETNNFDFCNNGRIAVKTCKGDMMREIRLLTALQDPNLARVFGVCTAEQPPWLILEYPAEYGDILFLLQNRPNIKYNTLIFMSTQIASAMKYLESKNLVHKDLAARNCLVSRGFLVKVADVAICNNAYRRHYADLKNRPAVPIRWLPWESILLERYICSSTAWSFGVTLWEILNLARDMPYPHLTDEQVIQNAKNLYYGNQLQINLLPKPVACSIEIYELMGECWTRDYNQRPTFKKIYSFLKQNNTIYTADFDLQQYLHHPLDIN